MSNFSRLSAAVLLLGTMSLPVLAQGSAGHAAPVTHTAPAPAKKLHPVAATGQDVVKPAAPAVTTTTVAPATIAPTTVAPVTAAAKPAAPVTTAPVTTAAGAIAAKPAAPATRTN